MPLPLEVNMIVVLLSGIALLRLSGNRSIAQMTASEAVILISLGTLLITPVSSKNLWVTIYAGLVFVLGMVVVSWIQIIFPNTRKWFTGTPTTLIENGVVQTANMKKAKMNMDVLEMRLRKAKVANIKDVKIALLEPSGELSIELISAKQAVTQEDLLPIRQALNALLQYHQLPVPKETEPSNNKLFQEGFEESQGANLMQ